MTRDALDLEPDPYHDLREQERDHLLAAALYARKRDELPSVRTLRITAGRVSPGTPAPRTTDSALDDLEDAGYIERIPDEHDARAVGVRVTDAGHRVLARGAARLDAGAGGDA